MIAGDLLQGGSNGVFYHAVEAPVESVVRCTLVLMLAERRWHGAVINSVPLTIAAAKQLMLSVCSDPGG